MKPLTRFFVTLAVLAGVMLALAATSSSQRSAAAAPIAGGVDAQTIATVTARLGVRNPDEVRATPIPGLYEVRSGAQVVYVSADGRFGISGDVFDLSSQTNLTEQRRRAARLALVGGIPESQMLVFGAPELKYTVTVFTDVDCVYCRKLHSQITDYNRIGIRVRYVSFPRTGPDTESWYKAEQVWCSPDRNAALTRAKLGEALDAQICKDNPVALEYGVGGKIGLTGTPDIITPRGDLLPGYLSPQDLLEELQDEQAPAGKS